VAPASDLPVRIGRLDAGALTAFVDALLRAEAARLALPATALVMSTNLNVADAGLDAVLHGVPPGGPLPAGTSGWQLKATKRITPSALKLKEDLAKRGPRRLLADGGTYVLLCSQELNKRQHDTVMGALYDAAPGTPPERLMLFDVTAITALAERHPAVVQQFGLSTFATLRTMEELSRQLQVDVRPYVTDAARDAIVERLAGLVTAPGRLALRAVVLGLPGTGKTRVVYEALVRAGLDDDALYADTWEDMERFLAWVAREPRSRGVLVVDDTGPAADPALIDRLGRRLLDGGAEARWRVVAVASLRDGREPPSRGQDIVVPPLDEQASASLRDLEVRLPDAVMERVAEASDGFPVLAFALIYALRDAPAPLALGDLVQSREPNALLSRVLEGGELLETLGPLSLFGTIGVEGDQRHELAAIAGAFSVSVGRLRATVRNQLAERRFVAKAGPYAFVTPQALAIWLAAETIRRTGDIDDVMARLPRELRLAFHDQLSLFGDRNPALVHAVADLLAASDRVTPEGFDAVGADLLRAAAAVVPDAVAGIVAGLLEVADAATRRRLLDAGLLGAVVRLVRDPRTLAIAVPALLALAAVAPDDSPAVARFMEAFDPTAGVLLGPRMDALERRLAMPLGAREIALATAACDIVADGGSTLDVTLTEEFVSYRSSAASHRGWHPREPSERESVDGAADVAEPKTVSSALRARARRLRTAMDAVAG
jgi:hypothetical protein